MSPSSNDDPIALEFSREQAWVAHVAVHEAGREAVEAGDTDPSERRLADAIEGDRSVQSADLSVLRDALVAYLGDAPLRDRAPGRAALHTVNEALGVSTADA